MKRTLLLFVLAALLVNNGAAQSKLNADTEKTKLTWLGEKVTGEHNGTINLKSGWLSMQDNKITSGEFVIDMTSLKDSEANARLETHLKSEDFFGVEKFPEAKLVVTGSTPYDKGTGVVSGTLTIKGITNPIEFKSTMQKKEDGVWFFANIVSTEQNIMFVTAQVRSSIILETKPSTTSSN